MRISKWIMWIISKSHREKNFFFDIFAIHLSSKYEKRCQMYVRLFCLFHGSKTQGCIKMNGFYFVLSYLVLAPNKEMHSNYYSKRYAQFVPVLSSLLTGVENISDIPRTPWII